MKALRNRRSSHMLSALLLALYFAVTGCAGHNASGVTGTGKELHQEAVEIQNFITLLVSEVLKASRNSVDEIVPVAVVISPIKQLQKRNELDEMVIDALKQSLRKKHELYSLSRQNWFEIIDGRPLTFSAKPLADRQIYKNMIVYHVETKAYESINKISVRVSAVNAEGRAIPGISVEKNLISAPLSLVSQLYAAPATDFTTPEGLAEKPYQSLDRLSYSLISELVDSYKQGINSAGFQPADEEVNVVLLMKEIATNNFGHSQAIQGALQQEIARQRGFSCSLGAGDYQTVIDHLESVQQAKLFEHDRTVFQPGTVFLLAEIADTEKDIASLSLRSLWRVGPLVAKDGNFIAANMAGTYVNGFAAKAYFNKSTVGVKHVSGAQAMGHFYKNTSPAKTYRFPDYE